MRTSITNNVKLSLAAATLVAVTLAPMAQAGAYGGWDRFHHQHSRTCSHGDADSGGDFGGDNGGYEVPEMDAGFAALGLGLTVGLVAFIRDRRRRK